MSPLRRLLRSVRALARPPWRLAALLGRPLRRFHPKLQRVVRIPGGPHPFSDEAIWHLSGQRAEFAVPPVAGTARGLCPALEVVTSYEDDLAELQRRLEALQVFTHRLAQLAPAPLTPSSHAAPAAPAAQRRREGLRMLQPGDKPEVGSILIAHPMSCIFQPDLDRAVIVIDEVHPGHVRGLVLNKPGGILMETLKPEELERAKEAGLSGLLHNRLYLGGDLMDAEDLVNHVRWLHSSDLPGAQRLAPGLHCGGEGLAQLGAARPVLGFAGWHQDQLDLELERGVWVHLRAHSAVGLLPNDGDAETLWNDLAEAVGLSSFSSFPRGPEVDQLIKQHLDEHSRWQIAACNKHGTEQECGYHG